MAQKKLLCILVLLIAQNIFADELTTCRQKVSAEDIKWISQFTDKEQVAFWQRMQNISNFKITQRRTTVAC